jgi:hypothetical protein
MALDIAVPRLSSRPARGRGPFPGSASPGHSVGLPIQLQLQIPVPELRQDGTTVVDFAITNVGTEPLKLPSSVAMFDSPMEELNLWITSGAIKDQYAKDVNSGRLFKIALVPISAELDGDGNQPRTFYILNPKKSIRVHAPSPQLKVGAYSFTAHAELLRTSVNGSQISSNSIGTAESEVVLERITASPPNTP